MRIPLALFALLLFFLHCHSKGKQDIGVHFTDMSGLPNNNVFCAIQDRNCLIWIGTQHGVARYDGQRFESFSTANGLAGNEIIQIYEDKKGRIWFLSISGRLSFFFKGKIHNSTNTSFLNDLTLNNFCSTVYEDEWGNIYFGSSSGELVKMGQDECIVQIIPPNKNWGWTLGMRAIAEDSLFIVSSPRNVATIAKHKVLYQKGHLAMDDRRNIWPLKSLLRKNGDLVMSWERSLGFIDSSGNQSQYWEVLPTEIQRRIVFVGEDKSQNIWLGTTKGAFRTTYEDLGCHWDVEILKDHQVQFVLEDHEGGTWFCTTRGLIYYPEIYNAPPSPYSYPWGGGITAFLKMSDTTIIWGNEKGAVFEKNLLTNLVSTIVERDSTGDNPIMKFRRVDNGHLWILGDKEFMEYANGTGRHIRAIKVIDALRQDENLCLCMPRGIFIVDFSSRTKFVFGSRMVYTRESMIPGRCFAIDRDLRGRIWIGAADGLFVLEKGNLSRVTFLDNHLKVGQVTDIESDRHGGIWIGTDASGLFYLHRSKIFHFDTHFGLPNNEILQIEVDSQSRLWVRFKEGIYCILYDSLDNKNTPFQVAPFFMSEKVLQMQVYGNEILILTRDQIVSLGTCQLWNLKSAPKPLVLKVEVNGREIDLTSRKTLPYGLSNLTIHFTGVSYKTAQGLNFQYRLNQEWTLTTSRSITFSKLEPGEYQFELKVRSYGAPWSAETAIFRFSIASPFWLMPGFISTLALLLIFGGVLIFVAYGKMLQRKADTRRKLLESEHRALITQMNPHFIFNSLNSIQNFFLKQEIEVANEHLADFSSLMRAILDSGRANRTSLKDEISLLRLYLGLERMRANLIFEFEIEVSLEIDIHAYDLPPLIIQPFVENAIWHGVATKKENGKIEIRFWLNESHLVCQVLDNGVGRKVSETLRSSNGKTHISHATSIVKERLDLLNEGRKAKYSIIIDDLYDHLNLSLGTSVLIFFPLNLIRKDDKDSNS